MTQSSNQSAKEESDKLWRDAATLCGDTAAHVLLVRDALDQQSARALVAAVRALARARGLSRLASDAGVSTRLLTEALQAANESNPARLQQLAATLAGRWSSGADKAVRQRGRQENDKKRPGNL